MFFFGAVQNQIPFGDGTLCLQLPIQRLPIERADGSGILRTVVDLSIPPGATIVPGVTWNFQAIFRDGNGGPSGFNLSDGLALAIAP